MRWIATMALIVCGTAGAVGIGSAAPELTAGQIIEKNVQARGGLEAWRRIQTMVWAGHMETPGGPVSEVPFVLQQKRPNKTRFELNAMGERTLRVFDGRHGWKVRPGQGGRADVEPFSPQELQYARSEVVIDSPLFDSRRYAVELQGLDLVDGRKAYRLVLRTASGEPHNVWVDAQTFLDVKYDRTAYTRAGLPTTVEVRYRDFRAVEGLQVPGVIETGTDRASEKLVIEKIALNPPLDDRLFGNPGGPHRRAMVTIDPEPAPMQPPPSQPGPAAATPPNSGSGRQ